MGRGHRQTVILDSCLVTSGEKEGAKVLCDGRDAQDAGAPNGLFVGATIVDQVQNEMSLAREEVFGPVLNVMRMEDRSGDGADEQILLWQRRRHFY
jgi:acyl-CoA reductase-like NAD-dependent aldehyde dehydrogenase